LILRSRIGCQEIPVGQSLGKTPIIIISRV
jgi:hypothetical protein